MGKRKIKIDFALRDICLRYKSIKKSEIEIFAPVFYPIASIQADMQEKTFEDFESVQEAVLKFVNLGFDSEEVIADLMGLDKDYVYSMLKLLFTFGHIDNKRKITELGKASLSEGKKITLARTKQVFMLDAINCNIIRIDRDLDRTVVENAHQLEDWEKNIQFLDHADGISKSRIEEVLTKTQYNTLRRIRGGLNINVCDVSNVECLGIKFIKSYLIKVKNHPPVIFIKRYDFNAEGTDRFFWLPFSVESRAEAEFLGLDSDSVSIHAGTAKEIIDDVYKRILESMNSEKMNERLNSKAEHYRQVCGIDLVGKGLDVKVSSGDVIEYSNKLLFILKEFSEDGNYLIVDDNMSGKFFYLYPDKSDTLLKECSDKIKSIMDKYSYERVVSHIEGNYNENDNVIKELLRIVDIPISN